MKSFTLQPGMIGVVVLFLISSSVQFTVTPLPDDEYEVEVKEEFATQLQRFLEIQAALT